MNRNALQRHRVNRVINYAQTHLAEPLNLDALADVACLSKYHFARVFTAHCSQTPLRFLWRLRLERAARNLAFVPDAAITDIAIDCGFSCSQAFSLAFKQRYRLSPRSFRRANPWGFARSAHPQRDRARVDAPLSADLEAPPVRIERRPAYHVAYIRYIGSYGDVDGGITKTFAALRAWAISHGLWQDNTALIGLCPDSPAITPAGLCIYDACMPVPDDWPEDDIVSIQTIPAGVYAVLESERASGRILSQWEWLTSCWLPISGETYELENCYEYFPMSGDEPCGPQGSVELCLRVKPR